MKTNGIERLDSFSKILLATQSINYMANVINGVRENLVMCKAVDEVIKEMVEVQTELLDDTVCELSIIMNKLGDYMNAHDCISPIDGRITNVAFEIIVQGKDETKSENGDTYKL
jgi:hypothetical protein